MTAAREKIGQQGAQGNSGMSAREFATLLGGNPMFRDALRDQKWAFDVLWGVKEHHPDTLRHSARVGHIMGEMSGGDSEQRNRRVLMGLTHDHLKTHVPITILDKPGRLKPGEKAVIEGHVEYAEDDPVKIHRPDVAKGNVRHHLHQPNPYPVRLLGVAVHRDVAENGERIAVADQADATMSSRSYKEAWSAEKAKAVLTGDALLPPELIAQAVDLRANMPDLEQPATNVIYLFSPNK